MTNSKWPMDLKVGHAGVLSSISPKSKRYTQESLFPSILLNLPTSHPIYGDFVDEGLDLRGQRFRDRFNVMSLDDLDKEIINLNKLIEEAKKS